ncbi:uncharacterized protein [Pleurodeles waltl]|uniref:uncharacterized protein n=1 Tax=Pleurodeles waltl TaxID=8319 RepID=UPI00370983FD
MIAIDGNSFSATRKKGLLLNVIGTEAQEIFDHLPPHKPPEGTDINDYDVFSEALDRLQLHFTVEPNVVTERFNFYSRHQFSTEPVEGYVAALRILASTCDFGVITDQYIRDQVIMHCYNKKIQEQLLRHKNPSLKEVIEVVKGIERSIRSCKTLNDDKDNHLEVAAIRNVNKNKYSKGYNKNNLNKLKCMRCGSNLHTNKSTCPALFKECFKCGKTGHFSTVCRSQRNVNSIVGKQLETEHCIQDVESVVLMITEDKSKQHNIFNTDIDNQIYRPPKCEVIIDGFSTIMLVDSGSPFSIISEAFFNKNWSGRKLESNDIKAYGYSQTIINILGYFVASISCHDHNILGKIYVVDKGQHVLGWRHQGNLGMVLDPSADVPVYCMTIQQDFERDSNTERSQLTPGIVGNEETPIDCNEDFEIIDSTFVPIVPNVNKQDNVQVKDYVHERVNNDSVDLPKRVSVLPKKYADFVLC